MKLTLKIENFDYLPDGGPLEFSVGARGCEVGRDSTMDWTLPDPNRHISSRHFEIVFRDQNYYLNDLSINGTFVYGQSMRVSSPLLLAHNERLQVGQYIIRVLIEAAAQGGQHGGPVPLAAPSASDPWSLPPGPSPMPAAMPSRPSAPLAGQFGDSFIQTPPPVQSASPFAPPLPLPPAAEPFVLQTPPPAAPPVPSAPPVRASAGAGLSLLDAICKGAGLPAGSLASADIAALGEEIGRCLRIATEELMALLGARAAAKQFVKSASRTMIGGTNNSPLKFKPNATEALTAMFLQRNDSFLSSTASFQQGFDDIKRHQTAVYAAMQPALAKLLEDLSPESIEERAAGSIMSSKKARAWETYVERWDAKTHPYENGMLDVFLVYFADSYDEAVKKTGAS